MIAPILRGMYDDLAAVGAITEAQRFELEVLLEERITDEQRRVARASSPRTRPSGRRPRSGRRWWRT